MDTFWPSCCSGPNLVLFFCCSGPNVGPFPTARGQSCCCSRTFFNRIPVSMGRLRLGTSVLRWRVVQKLFDLGLEDCLKGRWVMRAICGQYAGNIRAICGQYAGNMWAICGQYVAICGNMWAICGQYVAICGNMRALYGQYVGNMALCISLSCIPPY